MQLDIDQTYGPRRRAAATMLLRLLARGLRPYQPVTVGKKTIAPGRRGTHERLDALLPVLHEASPRLVVDLGSAEGYFVRRCTEAGYPTLGVEADVRRLMLAQMSLTLDAVEGFGFWRQRIAPDTVALLPEADATLCLSLFHHVVYGNGLDYATDLLRAIRAKTHKVLIFEMGYSTETAFPWASRLPDMGADPEGWVASFLTRAGFADPEVICRVESYNSDLKRATFVAR